MKFPELYTKDSKGKLRIWNVYTEADEVIVEHGQIGGKQSQKRYKALPKNQGKANATSAEEQAVKEAKAKWDKALKEEYFQSKEEALGHISNFPMKCHKWDEHKDKLPDSFVMSSKLNGRRIKIDLNLNAMTKSGEPCKVLSHWVNDLTGMFNAEPRLQEVDCEIYRHGMSLQEINSAYLTEQESTKDLELHIFDCVVDGDIPNMGYCDRMDVVTKAFAPNYEGPDNDIYVWARGYTKGHKNNILFVEEFYQLQLTRGFEGVVYRDPDARYEHGKRSYGVLKRKPRPSTEALVVGCVSDKNDEGVLTCQLHNGKLFKVKMRKDADVLINYREFENASLLIGKHIEVEYEDMSDDGKPQKPVGKCIRKVDENWEAIE